MLREVKEQDKDSNVQGMNEEQTARVNFKNLAPNFILGNQVRLFSFSTFQRQIFQS